MWTDVVVKEADQGGPVNFCYIASASKPEANTMESPLSLSSSDIEDIRGRFRRNGFHRVRAVLRQEELAPLRDAIDRIFERDWPSEARRFQRPFLALRIFELDPLFRRLMVRESLLGLIRHVVSPDCRVVSMNVIRNAPGQCIDRWHIDRPPLFAIEGALPRHDPQWLMPVPVANVQVALTDVTSLADGPTQYVPESHYSGRDVPADANTAHRSDKLSFDGQSATTVFWEAGDVILHNLYTWHRGTPNTSAKTRYLVNITYARPEFRHFFEGGYAYQPPHELLSEASEAELAILGFEPCQSASRA